MNLWEVVNATGTSNDGYDLLGRVGRLKSNFGTVSTYRNYEQFTGALASQAVVSIYGTRAYGVDSIVHVGTKLSSFDDTTVAGTTTTYGYTYDESGRLATAKASRLGPAAISQAYGEVYSARDAAWTTPGASLENLQGVTDEGGTTSYQYAGDRVTALTGATAATMAYDDAGRATSRVAASVEVEGFVHDSLDRLTTIRRNGAVSEVLEYAPTGEPVFRKLGTQGTWYVGAVTTVTGTVAAGCTGIDTVLIPVASRCVAVVGTVKVTAHVQVAGGRVASIRAAAGTGVELDPVSEVLYYHRDMQGSVVATTYRSGGQNGFMGAKYRYTPYGALDRTENVTATTDSELGYTGGLRLGYAAGVAQQGNLVLLGARVYHAELKRWLVPDTVDQRRYTYAGGDPVNFVDPSGRMAINGGGGGGGSQTAGGGGLTVSPGPQAMMRVTDEIPSCDVWKEGPCRLSDGSVVNPQQTAVCGYTDGTTRLCGYAGGGGGNSRPPPPGSYLTNPGGGGGGTGRPPYGPASTAVGGIGVAVSAARVMPAPTGASAISLAGKAISNGAKVIGEAFGVVASGITIVLDTKAWASNDSEMPGERLLLNTGVTVGIGAAAAAGVAAAPLVVVGAVYFAGDTLYPGGWIGMGSDYTSGIEHVGSELRQMFNPTNVYRLYGAP